MPAIHLNIKQPLIAAAIMFLTSISLAYMNTVDDRPLKRGLAEFPMQIANWHGTIDHYEDRIYRILGVDDAVLVNYRNERGEYIQLYIGYYKNQREGKIIHSPRNCMPGAGWNVIDSAKLSLNLKSKNAEAAKVTKLILENGIQQQVAFYWFHSRGRIIGSEYFQKIYLVWDAIIKQRTDGAFVRIVSPVSEDGELQTTENLKEFCQDLMPFLNQFLPA